MLDRNPKKHFTENQVAVRIFLIAILRGITYFNYYEFRSRLFYLHKGPSTPFLDIGGF